MLLLLTILYLTNVKNRLQGFKWTLKRIFFLQTSNEAQQSRRKKSDQKFLMVFLMFILALAKCRTNEFKWKKRITQRWFQNRIACLKIKGIPPKEHLRDSVDEIFSLSSRCVVVFKFFFCATQRHTRLMQQAKDDRNQRKNWPSWRINANAAWSFLQEGMGMWTIKKNKKKEQSIEIVGERWHKNAQKAKYLKQIQSPFIFLYAFKFFISQKFTSFRFALGIPFLDS